MFRRILIFSLFLAVGVSLAAYGQSEYLDNNRNSINFHLGGSVHPSDAYVGCGLGFSVTALGRFDFGTSYYWLSSGEEETNYWGYSSHNKSNAIFGLYADVLVIKPDTSKFPMAFGVGVSNEKDTKGIHPHYLAGTIFVVLYPDNYHDHSWRYSRVQPTVAFSYAAPSGGKVSTFIFGLPIRIKTPGAPLMACEPELSIGSHNWSISVGLTIMAVI